MKLWIRTCGLLLLLLPIICHQRMIYANENPEIDITAKSAVVMEGSTGKVLYAKHEKKELAPASVTKVMSLLLIFEQLDGNNLKKTDTVSISEHAASMGGSQVFLEPGEKQRVDDLIKCMVISSANDATVAMAEKIAGSEEAFVKRMNDKAKKLGMKHTKFQNCCGLDTKNHHTSALDIALMSREIIEKHPDIFSYTKIWMDSITHKTKKGSKKFGLSNTNKLIRQYDGCNGLKTGSTSKAKFCLSATAKKNGIQMIAVVMGSDSSKDRMKDCGKLLDYGFSVSQKIKRITKPEEIGAFLVERGNVTQMKLKEDVVSRFVLFHLKDESKLKRTIVKKNLTAPIQKGDTIGKILYSENGTLIHCEKILAPKAVSKAGYLDYMKKILYHYF